MARNRTIKCEDTKAYGDATMTGDLEAIAAAIGYRGDLWLDLYKLMLKNAEAVRAASIAVGYKTVPDALHRIRCGGIERMLPWWFTKFDIVLWCMAEQVEPAPCGRVPEAIMQSPLFTGVPESGSDTDV